MLKELEQKVQDIDNTIKRLKLELAHKKLKQKIQAKLRRLRKKQHNETIYYIINKLCDDIYFKLNINLDNHIIKNIAYYI